MRASSYCHSSCAIVNLPVLMPTSDDEYGFDDLVLDDRALAVLDATERSLATAFTPAPRPRSSPEQQPSKRLKTDHEWVQLQGRQPRERSPPSMGLTKARFSLEDTDLPEITISNGFYSGPGRFFVGSQHSEPSASPKPRYYNCESVDSADSDVILLSVPTEQQTHAPRRDVVATSNNSNSRIPSPSHPKPAPRFSRERNTPIDVVPSPGSPPVHPSPASGSSRAPLTKSLVRSSSFNDAMRAALRNAMSEVDSPALRRSSSTTASYSPPLLSAEPRAYSQRQVPTQIQAMTNPRLERPSYLQCPEQSIPTLRHLHPPRQPSLHGATGPQLTIVSEIPTQHQPTLRDRGPSSIGGMYGFRDELESLKSQVEEVCSIYTAVLPQLTPVP
jgi:hypothetical protein